MPEIGVRELKTSASAIVRAVREQHARYVVTYRGRPVGILMPIDEAPPDKSRTADEVWQELTELGKKIGEGWKSSQTSAEIISEMRR
jgi:prevent-host-death family protein